jgi:NADH-quinone oxidoreductase subunit A
MQNYLPILLQVVVVLGFGITTLLISVLFGKSGRRTPTKDMAYECGMIPQGEGQPRFSVKFYLVAMLFILFDIEVVFLYPWAVNFKAMLQSHGNTIFWSMAGFLGL